MNPLRSTQIPVTDPAAGLRITEIFYSLQGEARDSGYPTVFVRLTGCPLRCTYCDTAYAFEGGIRWSLDAILAEVAQHEGVRHVCVTGGEPLAQPNCIPLLHALCNAGYVVSLETSGAIDVSTVDLRVSRVVDLKTPDSGEMKRNLLTNLPLLTKHDQIKFVITSRTDYEWSRDMLKVHELDKLVGEVWFSPSFAIEVGQVKLPKLARELADWIVEDKLPVRFQLQLHKLLWQDEAGR
ncbi:7-carboxy-7-deazaguanine synthase QueE [Aquirhabdus parva]|uniref:7-carboxy-7-deazaguanine synthase n=1 Tax=Aquirhabdus parva TaxID=2283318 RepID=A0A345P5K6_9GAMM|nr:7-carboxy-7-deazaguanine synthase QueE [Aquirhabdus parva]AXI02565.1 7-carboxy-7-deazaguanine synthase QueE [Aquirhabdus parva]